MTNRNPYFHELSSCLQKILKSTSEVNTIPTQENHTSIIRYTSQSIDLGKREIMGNKKKAPNKYEEKQWKSYDVDW